ncbi:MAG: MFS transporter [Candidatus Obscuribacterales bacterium]|nr:MFS transporter [Candidatus Obscuribacterales bacterium]
MAKRSPWVYIPTLYFAEGLPYTVVMMMSAVYFKDLGASNVLIGLTSALQLPWMLKFAWAPLIDFFGRKKHWIVVAQVVLTILFIALALSSISTDPVNFGIAVLAITALASATHDASIDGYYLEALEPSQQALFVGVRNTAFRLSMIFGSGAMVCLAGSLTAQTGKSLAWMTAFLVIAAVMLLGTVLHAFYLPNKSQEQQEEVPQAAALALALADSKASNGRDDAAANNGSNNGVNGSSTSSRTQHPPRNYLNAILSYFAQPGAIAIVFYILLFRLGDAMVMKMIPPFLQDPIAKGGMNLSVQTVGQIYGTVGVGFLLLGGIVGGYLVSKQGLKRWFWPATLVMNGTIVLYWLLAVFHPQSILWIYVVNSLEQFGYGFGMAAYTVFLLSTVSQEYKAAHYAVATALMALGLMVPGMASGYVYEAIGYANFFLLSFLITVPGMISICFLPVWKKETKAAVS